LASSSISQIDLEVLVKFALTIITAFFNKIIKLIVVSLKGKSGLPIGENASCFSKRI
jgi:hypothetical protein